MSNILTIVNHATQKFKFVSFSAKFSQLVSDFPGTQAELAALLDLSEGSIVNYKKGRIPKSDELWKIAKFFGVTMESLVSGEESAPERRGEREKNETSMREDPVIYGAKKPPPRSMSDLDRRLTEVIAELQQIKAEIQEHRN